MFQCKYDIRKNTRTLNDTMIPYVTESKVEWENFRTKLTDRIRFSSGVNLLQHNNPLNAHVFGAVEYDNFIVEKVYFQSLPGFYVTGNLFRPKDITKKYPAILNPHGHWKTGRIYIEEDGALPQRCANLAIRGFVAFLYDMIGYNDSCQVPHKYEDTEADLWNIGRFGQQLNNSIKSVDFLLSLPYVDASRIGCTGASGGATQTFFLAAVDERIKATAPVNMVSGIMQGGCNCENAPYLRTDCCNIDYMSLTAPRDAFMSACDGDWTVNSPETEFVAVKNIYKLYGAEEKLQTFYQHSGHNYNRPIRERVYDFFCNVFHVENHYDGEVQIDINPESLLLNNISEIKGAVKGDAELFALQKNIISENLKKLTDIEFDYIRKEIFGINVWGYHDPHDRLISRTNTDKIVTEQHELFEDNRSHVLYKKLFYDNTEINKTILYLCDHDISEITPLLTEGYTVIIPQLFKEETLYASTSDKNINYYYTYNYSDDALRICDLHNLYVYFQQEFAKSPDIIASGKYSSLCTAAGSLFGDIKLTVYPKAPIEEQWWLKMIYIPGMMLMKDTVLLNIK